MTYRQRPPGRRSSSATRGETAGTPPLRDLLGVRPVLPAFLSDVLSILYVGIYWNNHHHVFHAVERVSGMMLWANLHLLFWLSLIPFVTRSMGESHFGTWPVV